MFDLGAPRLNAQDRGLTVSDTTAPRCCRWLLSMHDRMDQDTLPLTHEFLAEMLGVQRSTVSATLPGLQCSGLIEQRRGDIEVSDRARLEQDVESRNDVGVDLDRSFNRGRWKVWKGEPDKPRT